MTCSGDHEKRWRDIAVAMRRNIEAGRSEEREESIAKGIRRLK